MTDFDSFFRAVHKYDPFPWQSMLAARVDADGDWPGVIDLPTASGKTAVIDVAVWALARQADRRPEDRTAPRRVWLVVDRRIVVDEAYRRGERIRDALVNDPTLTDVADALRRIGGTGRPLAVGRLRGGVLRDDGWAAVPSQPAVITSTVDQVGSRLLFRGYGAGALAAPVHAALAAYDSLIVLDEAHCAVPFTQTLEWVQHYRDATVVNGGGAPRWADRPIPLPLRLCVMSATPPRRLADRPGAVFPSSGERAAALDHPRLRQRMGASKPATLVPAEKPNKPRKGQRPRETLVPEATAAVARFINDGRRRVAVMVNRVDTAAAISEALGTSHAGSADVVLLTGRMRPVDRDAVVNEWTPALRAGSDLTPDRPVVLVTTQCMEVGADFSFDALVTECASLDALRQRFGRLDRLGTIGTSPAAILAWRGDLRPAGDLDDADPLDPIYGNALSRTWDWLGAAKDAAGVVDFGIAAIAPSLPADLAPLLAPTPDAPVMLPAYVDAWCQTGPSPAVEPDVSLFLHGPQRDAAEARVLWRADVPEPLSPDADDQTDREWRQKWIDTVALCPPVSGEMLTVRLGRLRQYLEGRRQLTLEQFDVEGARQPEEPDRKEPPAGHDRQPFLVYRGRRAGASFVTRNARKIVAGDLVVMPADEDKGIPPELGHKPSDRPVDCYEEAFGLAKGRTTLRLTPPLEDRWFPGDDGAAAVRAWLKESPEERERSELMDALAGAAANPALAGIVEGLGRSPAVRPHPAGGVVLTGPAHRAADGAGGIEDDPFDDDDDGRSLIGRAVPLDDHAAQVADLAGRFARACLPEPLARVVERAAAWHDLGKADPRFQGKLRNEPLAYYGDERLAKSGAAMPSPRDGARLNDLLGLPSGWRHEMLSLALAERLCDGLPAGDLSPDDRDLLLHLIAAHHGHARPFAPVVVDEAAEDATAAGVTVTAGQRLARPPHRLDSGVADRFWRLTRRHGWWGLAYLETTVRLADWHASNYPQVLKSQSTEDPGA